MLIIVASKFAEVYGISLTLKIVISDLVISVKVYEISEVLDPSSVFPLQ